ncbi:tetratricopeptide repeat protein 29 isoform X2 [Acanthochromis polyacanthus]|uniref:tetratricopeptide repeat protein 29 isoform X2 n=1 Tax=Acanthochromis polyacanthus TaxID=80966 RepID=UPI0022340A20|nr:tetratricopeptide repeat protein 29 isoform X2 [Acanthochromis polyacanthus]XP_051800224.1 tetratricopeptide repeat protein 29 isoform X2 [Acanthochromis polyacanthus]
MSGTRRRMSFRLNINTQNRMEQQTASLQTESSPDNSSHLSRREIGLFRNSLKQNVCVQLLQDGDHRSFSELFRLLASDRDRREASSAVRLQTPPLEEQLDKLETMKLHLSRAERAERTGLWSSACEELLLLGRFFSSPEDLWLRVHFYRRCSDGGRGSRPAVEAQLCLAELQLEDGEVEQVRQQVELSLQQMEDGWLDSESRSLKLRTLRVLWRIYSRLADAPLAAGDLTDALELLHEGYRISTQTEDKRMEGEAAFKLGLAYQSAGEHEAAKQHLSSCMQICGSLQDSDGLTKAYKAMASSLQSEGNTDEAIQCLKKLADLSRSDGLQHNLAESLMSLGNIYYSRREHQRAAENFLQAYQVYCNTGDEAQLQKAQVMVATARAQCLIRKHIVHLQTAAGTPEPE